MRLIDLKCPTCSRIQFDHLERDIETSRPDCCGTPMERVFLPTQRENVIGDEIDVTIRHGLCGPNGEPQRFRSREALKKAAAAKGWTNYVRHVGRQGSDKSPHTVKWS